tara:strand:- start:432 stop:560 length:129 start_codon:yes stop_codon:yes gene_type:complete
MTTSVAIKQSEKKVHLGILLSNMGFFFDFEEGMIGSLVVIRY